MAVAITWLLMWSFTFAILDMDSAPHAEYYDVVLCGVFAGTKNYLMMDGLVTINNSMSLLRNPNHKQPQQIKPIWNGFHLVALVEDLAHTQFVSPLVLA